MNYIQKQLKKLESLECDERLTDLYCLLSFVVGKDCTWEDVHDAWAIWENRQNPDHKSLIPFEELSDDIQKLDADYARAIQNTTNT